LFTDATVAVSGPVDHSGGHARAAQAADDEEQRRIDIPPCIVPLSAHGRAVRHLLDRFRPAQAYLVPGDWCLSSRSARTRSTPRSGAWAMKDQLTGQGLRSMCPYRHQIAIFQRNPHAKVAFEAIAGLVLPRTGTRRRWIP
jgi:hypothetical protein